MAHSYYHGVKTAACQKKQKKEDEQNLNEQELGKIHAYPVLWRGHHLFPGSIAVFDLREEGANKNREHRKHQEIQAFKFLGKNSRP